MALGEYDVHLFDLDGTLVDVRGDYKHTLLSEVADELGCAIPSSEVHRVWHGLGDVRDDLFVRLGVTELEFWEAFDRVDEPAARAEQTFLYDDAAFVGDIDGPVGLVTHCPADKTERVLDHLDISDWFDTVVCCDEDVGWKPDPAPVERALSDLGVGVGADFDAGSRAGVLAGDSACDVGAAWNAGLDGVHVERHSPDRRGHCVLGDVRVESFDELTVATDGGRDGGEN